jgi:glyoxylase-like metal-dependent hydrolase (beta-lactamase superfamily II)
MKGLAYEDDRAEVHQMVVGRLDTNVYVLRCRQTGSAVLIDAADDADRLLATCQALGVTQVLETHGHWDHVQAVPALRAAGYPVLIAPADAAMISGDDGPLNHGTVVDVGALALHVLATPGHTPGSTCLRLAGSPLVFAGDTLFPGGPGATGGDPQRFATILDSIEEHLFTLAGDTVVLPGHGAATTIGTEQPYLTEWRERGW